MEIMSLWRVEYEHLWIPFNCEDDLITIIDARQHKIVKTFKEPLEVIPKESKLMKDKWNDLVP